MRKTRARGLRASSLLIGVVLALACAPPSSPERARSVFYASGADLQSINPLVTVHPLAKAVQKHLLFIPFFPSIIIDWQFFIASPPAGCQFLKIPRVRTGEEASPTEYRSKVRLRRAAEPSVPLTAITISEPPTI